MSHDRLTYTPEQEKNIQTIQEALNGIHNKRITLVSEGNSDKLVHTRYTSNPFPLSGQQCLLDYFYYPNNDISQAPIQTTVFTIETVIRTITGNLVAYRAYYFQKVAENELEITGGLQVFGENQSNRIGVALLLTSDTAIQYAINYVRGEDPTIKHMEISAVIADRAESLEADKTGKKPERFGWTSAVMESGRMQGYKKAEDGVYRKVFQTSHISTLV